MIALGLPRVLTAVMAGIGLGASGSVYQTIFKNPLASPDIIGVAPGANLGAAAAIVFLGMCLSQIRIVILGLSTLMVASITRLPD